MEVSRLLGVWGTEWGALTAGDVGFHYVVEALSRAFSSPQTTDEPAVPVETKPGHGALLEAVCDVDPGCPKAFEDREPASVRPHPDACVGVDENGPDGPDRQAVRTGNRGDGARGGIEPREAVLRADPQRSGRGLDEGPDVVGWQADGRRPVPHSGLGNGEQA